jgi:tetratricopeptide (TPR) repeat protein
MKRSLNVKFLVFLVVGFVLSGTGVHFLHAYQVKRNAKALLELADREAVLADRSAESANWLEERSHLLAATNYLSRYLAHKPRDVDALVNYGLFLERIAKAPGFTPQNEAFGRAFRAFDKILGLDPGQFDIRWKLARMTAMVERYSDAEAHLKILYKALPTDAKPKQKAELQRMLGQCCEASRKFEGSSKDPQGAKEYFEESIQSYRETSIQDAPDQIQSYVALANLYRQRLNNPEEADKKMNELIKKDESSFLVYLARASYWKDNLFPEKSAKEIERAYAEDIEQAYKSAPDYELALDDDLPPDGARVFLLFAELARDRGKLARDAKEAAKAFQVARGALKRGLQFFSKSPDLYQLLAEVELADNKSEEAKVWLKRGLKDLPEHPRLLWALANLALDEGKNDQDQELSNAIARMEKAGVLSGQVAYLKGRIQMNQQHWHQAIQILEQIRPGLMKIPDVVNMVKQIDLCLGRCYSQLDEPDLAYVAYRRALEPDPLDIPACLGMSSALLAMGRIDEAIETYRRIVAKSPLAKLETARLLIGKNLDFAKEQRQGRKIDEYLNDATVAKAFPVDVILLRADFLAAQGKLDEARDLLSHQEPEVAEIWMALAKLLNGQGKSDAALMILDEADKQLGHRVADRVALRLARADYWSNQEASVAKPALAKLEKDLQQFSSEDSRQILRGLASSYARVREMGEVKRLWNQLAKEQPDDLNIHLILFDIALGSGDRPAIDDVMEKIENIAGSDGTPTQFCKARYLIWQAAETRRDQKGDEASQGLLAEARKLLKKMAERRPLWSGIPLCEAWIEEVKQSSVPEKERDYGKAMEDYGQAIRQGERNPAVAIHLAQLLYKDTETKARDLAANGKPDEAVAAVRAYLEMNTSKWPERTARLLLAAQLLDTLSQAFPAQKSFAAAAEKLYRELTAAKPDQILLLVSFLEIQGRYDDAEKLYGDVIAKDPNNYVALNNLAWLLALRGHNADEALKLISRAMEIAGPLPELLDTQAVTYMALGDAEKAVQVLQQVMKEKPSAASSFHLAKAQLMGKNRPGAQGAFDQAEKLGLKPDQLHPLEQADYMQLRADLGR